MSGIQKSVMYNTLFSVCVYLLTLYMCSYNLCPYICHLYHNTIIFYIVSECVRGQCACIDSLGVCMGEVAITVFTPMLAIGVQMCTLVRGD